MAQLHLFLIALVFFYLVGPHLVLRYNLIQPLGTPLIALVFFHVTLVLFYLIQPPLISSSLRKKPPLPIASLVILTTCPLFNYHIYWKTLL